MHAGRSFSQVIEPQCRPIFAVAVRKNAIGGCGATEIEQGLPNGFENARDCRVKGLRVVLLTRSCAVAYGASS